MDYKSTYVILCLAIALGSVYAVAEVLDGGKVGVNADTVGGVPAATIISGASAGSTALQEIKSDTTPQLGGNLDAQDKQITNLTSITIGASNILFTTDVYNGSNSLFFVVGGSSVTNVIPLRSAP